MSKSPARDGRSLTISHSNVTFKQLRRFGLSVASAVRAMRVRRVLPYMEDAAIPCIDARKLWSKLGKPHKRFTDWASYHLKGYTDNPNLNAEISVFEDSSKAGKPTKDYILSRNIAAHLAMQANTEQGWEVRSYFLDMERIVFKLAEFNFSRASVPVRLDKRLYVASCIRFGIANSVQYSSKHLNNLCEVLTGLTAGQVRTKYKKTIRDILEGFPEYLDLYNDAHAFAVSLYECNIPWRKIKPLLKKRYSLKIDLKKLQATQ
jgi:phage anti-repressor protein